MKEKIDFENLPIYSDPIAITEGGKAKFHFDKAKKDWVVVDILKVEPANLNGYHIHWCMSHDVSKSFRTFVRPNENSALDGIEWVVGATLTAKMLKSIEKR